MPKLARSALIVGMLLLTVSRAHALVLPPAITWANPGPVPANGVVLLSSVDADEQAVVVTKDGAPVAGIVTTLDNKYAAFRGAQAFAPGSYHLAVAGGDLQGDFDVDFTVVAAYVPAAHELSLSLMLSTLSIPGGELACCEPAPETRTLDDGCFYTQLVEHYGLLWTAMSPLAAAHAQQFLYRVIATPVEDFHAGAGRTAFDEFRVGAARAELLRDRASEYCISVEATSLIDDSVFTTKACIADPGVERAIKARSNYDFAFSIESCPRPPAGLDELWCEHMWGPCVNDLQNSSAEFQTQRMQDCAYYYEMCRQPMEGPSDASSPEAGAQPTPMAAAPSANDASSCSVRGGAIGASGAALPQSYAWLLIGLCVVRRRRKPRAWALCRGACCQA